MAQALESEVENGRRNVCDQKMLIEWKTGMKAVLIE